MPSEHPPRLSAASRTGGDELPADLAALADQLSDDAARLAARYPAGECRPAGPVARPGGRQPRAARPLRTHLRWALAATILAGFSAGLAWRIARLDTPRAAPPADANLVAGGPAPTAHRSATPRIGVVEAPPASNPPGADARSALLSSGPDGAVGIAPAAGRLPRDEAALLRVQIDAFAQVIERLQAELARRDELQRQTNASLQSLTAEVARLRGELDARPAADAGESP
jgi:hypothetical protein